MDIQYRSIELLACIASKDRVVGAWQKSKDRVVRGLAMAVEEL
jgi:hypothetical protein